MVFAQDRVFSIGGWNDLFLETSNIYYSNKIASPPTESPTSLPSVIPTPLPFSQPTKLPTRGPVTVVSSTTPYTTTSTITTVNSSNSSQTGLNLSSSEILNATSGVLTSRSTPTFIITKESPSRTTTSTVASTSDPENLSEKQNQALIFLVIALSIAICLLCVCVGIMFFCRRNHHRDLGLQPKNVNVVDLYLQNKLRHGERNQEVRNGDISIQHANEPAMHTEKFDNDVASNNDDANGESYVKNEKENSQENTVEDADDEQIMYIVYSTKNHDTCTNDVAVQKQTENGSDQDNGERDGSNEALPVISQENLSYIQPEGVVGDANHDTAGNATKSDAK